MKRSEIYREAAERIAGMHNIERLPFFFQAFPSDDPTYDAARDFVAEYVDVAEGITAAEPDVRVLFLCLMAAIAEDSER